MTRTVTKHYRMYIDGYDLSGVSRECGPLSVEHDAPELTGWTDPVKGYLKGHTQVSLGTYNALFDNTATTGLHAVMGTAGGQRTVLLAMGMSAAPELGSPCFGGQFLQSAYQPQDDGGATVVSIPFAGWSTTAETLLLAPGFGQLQHASAARTAVNYERGVDNLTQAATTRGGVMVYEVLASSNAAHTATLKLQECALNWSATNSGLTNLAVTSAAIDWDTPANMYAGTNGGGVYKSTNSGATWAATALGGSIISVVIDPSDATILYAATDGAGVYRSANSGVAWATINTGLTDLVISALAIDPDAPTILYTSTGTGVFTTTDSGAHWTPANTGLPAGVTALVVDPVTTATLYAGVWGSGIYKSVDSGENWSASSTGLTNLYPHALLINATTPAILYAATEGGIFKTTDSGGTWAAASTGLAASAVQCLAINAATPTTLYAGTAGDVYRSADSGATWGTTGTGLPTDNVRSIALDPDTPTTLYAGLDGAGVYKATALTLYADVTGLTTGVITVGAGVSGLVATAPTASIKRFTRWQIVLGTATSATFVLSLHRG